jgi:hypothetical protein
MTQRRSPSAIARTLRRASVQDYRPGGGELLDEPVVLAFGSLDFLSSPSAPAPSTVVRVRCSGGSNAVIDPMDTFTGMSFAT